MKSTPPIPAGSEAILTALRREVGKAGGKRVSFRRFVASSSIPAADIFRHFAHWEDAVRAAGFDFRPPNRYVDPQSLLADWGALTRKLRRFPSKSEYRIGGEYCTHTFARHFAGWHSIPDAFLKFAKGRPEWADLRALVPILIKKNKRAKPSTHRRKRDKPPARPRKPHGSRWGRRANRGPIYGDPLDFDAMRNAPVNEAGVILLFAMMARQLGFIIEAAHATFPDCEARRKTGVNEWRPVRIEFEYESRNFRDHRHNPKGCDLIVCWAHNWPDCPLEVLALGDEIARMVDESPRCEV
jgi:hypothetical protein